jgi:hypothetical protein
MRRELLFTEGHFWRQDFHVTLKIMGHSDHQYLRQAIDKKPSIVAHIALLGILVSSTPKFANAADPADHRWTGEKGDVCGEFVGSRLVQIVPKKRCYKPSLVYFQWMNEDRNICVAYNVCGRLADHVSSEFCAKASNPWKSKAVSPGYSWKNCEHWDKNERAMITTPYGDDGKFRSECAPDVLYSWKKSELVDSYAKWSKPGKVLDVSRMIFTWRTPMGSFAYGNDAIRIKLKPDVKWVTIQLPEGTIANTPRDCSKLKKTYDIETTVFAFELPWMSGYSEYVLCSEGPVHSWSYGTSEFLNEIVAEKKWRETHPKDQYDQFFNNGCFIGCWFDGERWTRERLRENLENIQVRIDSGEGKIFFNNDVIPSRWDHFATKIPGYFNSYDGKQSSDPWPERDPKGCSLQTTKGIPETKFTPEEAAAIYGP